MVLCAVVPRPITVWSVNCTACVYKCKGVIYSFKVDLQTSNSYSSKFSVSESSLSRCCWPFNFLLAGRRLLVVGIQNPISNPKCLKMILKCPTPLPWELSVSELCWASTSAFLNSTYLWLGLSLRVLVTLWLGLVSFVDIHTLLRVTWWNSS